MNWVPIVESGQEGKGLAAAAATAKLYLDAVEGDVNDQVLRAWEGLFLDQKVNQTKLISIACTWI